MGKRKEAESELRNKAYVLLSSIRLLESKGIEPKTIEKNYQKLEHGTTKYNNFVVPYHYPRELFHRLNL